MCRRTVYEEELHGRMFATIKIAVNEEYWCNEEEIKKSLRAIKEHVIKNIFHAKSVTIPIYILDRLPLIVAGDRYMGLLVFGSKDSITVDVEVISGISDTIIRDHTIKEGA